MTPKEECEFLLNEIFNACEYLLKKNGEFYPIGAVIMNDSEMKFTAANLSGDEFPDSQSIINDLMFTHKQMAEKSEIKASGIAWMGGVMTPDGKQSDAIIVSLEHREDYSVTVGLPYSIGLFNKIKFGELFAQEGRNDIF